jgi:hypothetical protein
MKTDALLSVSLLLACVDAAAVTLPRQSNSGRGVVHLEMERRQIPASILSRRATGNAISSDLTNIQTGYTIRAKVGTPPQAINLLFDSGSSDFIVQSADAKFHPDDEDKGFREAPC